MNSRPTSTLGQIGLIWGLGGFIVLLLFAIYRLAPIAWHGITQPLGPLHWAVLLINTLFMAYSEGYKGFQRAYSPRVVARAWHLRDNPKLWIVVLAPMFCMAYFLAPRKRVITSWVLTIAIIILIIIFHRLPDPWRGILDAGVVVGLSWGIAATLAFAWKKYKNPDLALNPEVETSSILDRASDASPG